VAMRPPLPACGYALAGGVGAPACGGGPLCASASILGWCRVTLVAASGTYCPPARGVGAAVLPQKEIGTSPSADFIAIRALRFAVKLLHKNCKRFAKVYLSVGANISGTYGYLCTGGKVGNGGLVLGR